jgi:hypothetical protein
MVAKKNPHLLIAERGLRALYGTGLWRRLSKAQLAQQPMCAECLRAGRGPVRATHADHIVPFHDYDSFVSNKLQSLCFECSSTKQRGRPARSARPWTGLDGLPLPIGVRPGTVIDDDDQDDVPDRTTLLR